MRGGYAVDNSPTRKTGVLGTQEKRNLRTQSGVTVPLAEMHSRWG
jgi:hypothetical protein